VTVPNLTGQTRALGFEGTPTSHARGLSCNPGGTDGARQRLTIGRPQDLAGLLDLRCAADIRVSPGVADDISSVDEPAPELDVIRLHHRADVGQPVAQASIDLVFPKRAPWLDRAGSQGQDQRAVGFRQEAEMETALQDERLEARWQLHGWSLPCTRVA